MCGAGACGRGPRVFDPAVDVIAEREPERLDVVLEYNVDEFFGRVRFGVEEPRYETDAYRDRLVGPKLREATAGKREVLAQLVRLDEGCGCANVSSGGNSGCEGEPCLLLRIRSPRLGSPRPGYGSMIGGVTMSFYV